LRRRRERLDDVHRNVLLVLQQIRTALPDEEGHFVAVVVVAVGRGVEVRCRAARGVEQQPSHTPLHPEYEELAAVRTMQLEN
jgi:hypothetical protein